MSLVASIDASLTGLAVCVASPDQVELLVEFKSKPAKSLQGRSRRYSSLTRQVFKALAPYRSQLVLIGIEGYSFGSKSSSAVTLGEFGWDLRRMLLQLSPDAPVLEAAPATLKQFCAGKGNADKVEVATALARRYDREFATDNQADAFGLVQLLLCVLGQTEPSNEAQRKAVATVLGVLERERAAA